MREFCLTEEVIQQFVDGELSNSQTEEAAAHLASCDKCASLLDEVEQGNALLAEAFAPELTMPVPTVSLRERLDAEIARLEPQAGSARSESTLSRLRAWLSSFSFTPQQAMGFASLAVVLIIAAIFAAMQLQQRSDSQPAVAGNRILQPATARSPEPAPTSETMTPEVNVPSTSGTTVKVSSPAPRRTPTVKGTNNSVQAALPKATTPPTTASTEPKFLPGEKGYLEAIASLTTAIDANKDDVLKPTVRADYERNLAVVDQAIATTRQQAKKNPNNRDAVEFMYTAYQNKIDLLNAVADQTRIASR